MLPWFFIFENKNQQNFLFQSFPKNKDDIFPFNHNGYASIEDVHAYIAKSGVSKVTLDVEDIGSILETLRHDGKIEVRGDKFKAIRIKPMRNPGAEIPCGSCPVSLLFQLPRKEQWKS